MIFVLGAKGFVGAAVLKELEKYDRCAGIDVDNYDEHVGKECDIVVNANGNSKKFLAAEQPALEFDLSVRSVVRTISDFQFRKYVYVSSVDVYTAFSDDASTSEKIQIDNSLQSPYGFHKWLAEQYVRKMCDKWLIARLGGMVGPGLKKGPVYDLMHEERLRVHPDSRYQFIPTRTVGEVIRLLLTQNVENDIYNICASGTVSLREISEWLDVTAEFEPGAEKQHYEINNAKLRGMSDVPETRDTVRKFLKGEKS